MNRFRITDALTITFRSPSIALFFSCIFFFVILLKTNPAAAQNIQETRISITFDDVTLKNALLKIQNATSFNFIFVEEKIGQVKHINGRFENKPVSEILDVILKKAGMGYNQNGATIEIITAAPDKRSKKGILKGTVTDNKTKEPVIGASVRIGSINVQTDLKGNFEIETAPGNYSFELGYVGYKTLKQNVTVEEDKETLLSVSISEDLNTLGEIVVNERKVTGTSIALIATIKEARSVVSGISREQIGRSQDRDAAEVVRRIPGVSVIQDKFIVIRGLPQRYNTVMLNNVIAPSFEADSRAFSFDIIPSNMIDRILIYKTAVPELPADFAGGVVKIFTTAAPAGNSFNVTYQASYRPNTTFRDFYQQAQGKYAWLGFDDGTYGLPQSALNKELDPGISSYEKRIGITKQFNNNWEAMQKTALPDQRLSIDFTRGFSFSDKVKFGIVSNLGYTNAYKYTIFSRNTVRGSNNDLSYSFADQVYRHDIRLNGMLNFSLDIGNKHHIDFKNLYTHMGGTQYINRKGLAGPEAEEGLGFYPNNYIQQYALSNSFKDIYTGQINGSHELFSYTKLNWVLAYVKSNFNDPDERRRTRTAPEGTDNWSPWLTKFSTLDPNRNTRYYYTLPEETKTFGLDLEQKIPLGSFSPVLKAGLFFEDKARRFTTTWFTVKDDEPDALFEPSMPWNSYAAENKLRAGYIAAEIPFLKKFRFYGGLRLEDNQMQLWSVYWQSAGPKTGKAHVNNHVVSKLPSANLSYNFTEKSLLRVAYSRTLTRPEFRESSPAYFFDMPSSRYIYGQPDLKPQTDIDNYDLRFEHYPGPGEMFTAGIFYKRFMNPIELQYWASTSNIAFMWGNAEQADNYGAEVELMLGMGKYFNGSSGLSRQIQKLSLLFNVAYIFSEVDFGKQAGNFQGDTRRALYGQSPYLINAGLNYTDDKGNTKLNIAYNVTGKRIVAVGSLFQPHIYEMPRHSLDFTFSKGISKVLELRGGVQNILNSRSFQMQDSNGDGKFTVPDGNYTTSWSDNRYLSSFDGTYYTLGISVKL